MIENPFDSKNLFFTTSIADVKKEFKLEESEIILGEIKEEIKDELEYVRILREHNYIESDIPINSIYWSIRP